MAAVKKWHCIRANCVIQAIDNFQEIHAVFWNMQLRIVLFQYYIKIKSGEDMWWLVRTQNDVYQKPMQKILMCADLSVDLFDFYSRKYD